MLLAKNNLNSCEEKKKVHWLLLTLRSILQDIGKTLK